uniref:Potassium-transporting ATPase KdpC subunit n=1 Tax=Schlesneria paludicola TaxID=360056 RepID=A0A7C2JYS6_9PLAN
MSDLVTSLRLFVVSLVVCSAVYPLLVLALAATVAPDMAQGSLIRSADGTVVGSRLLAQGFTQPRYFWPRPSAVDYNAGGAGGSNLSPTNPQVGERAAETIRRLQPADGELVPADLVTASGSGLDPHISLAAARLQAPRVAQARGLPLEKVLAVVAARNDSVALSALGGQPLIHVLELNMQLDQMTSHE